jgi:hypothetical protein
MATTRSTATTPIRIPKTGFSSNGTGVPAWRDHYHHNTHVNNTLLFLVLNGKYE